MTGTPLSYIFKPPRHVKLPSEPPQSTSGAPREDPKYRSGSMSLSSRSPSRVSRPFVFGSLRARFGAPHPAPSAIDKGKQRAID